MDQLLHLVRENHGTWTLVALFAAAALEYLAPPLPADTIVLTGSLLVIAGAWSFPVVLAVAVGGGLLGSLIHYGLGRALALEGGGMRGERYIDWLVGKGALERFLARVRKHGLWVIAFNRMLPGIRGVTFLAAGAAKLPVVPTLALGLVSNIAWTFAILGLGVSVGGSWEKIQEAFRVYSTGLGIGVAVVGVSCALVFGIRKRFQQRAASRSPES